MRWRDIIYLSYRNLIIRRSRSLLTIGGVAVGIAAIIFLVSLGYGLQALAIRDTLQSKSLNYFDVRVGTGEISIIDPALLTKIGGFNKVKAVYPQLETPAKLSISGSESKADIIAFFSDTAFIKQSDIAISSGQLYADDKEEVVISSAVISLLNLPNDTAIGSKITFTPLLRSDLYIQGPIGTSATFTVVGIADDSDTPFLAAPIKPVSKAIGEFAYSAAKVEVENNEAVADLRTQIESTGGLQTEYVGDLVNQLNAVFSIVRTVLAGFGLIATFVAALGMFNTLSVSLMERTREIGIMKTLGTRRRDVWKLFLVEGLLISVLGGIAGIILGVGIGQGLNLIFNIVARSTNNPTTSFYYSPPVFLALIMGLVIILGGLVGLIPARRATRISPLEALRYE